MTATATKTRPASGIKFPRTELLAALQAVKHAIPSRSPRPILQNVLIGDGLMVATDLEVRIEVILSDHCTPFLAPHGRLLEIVRASTGDEVTLTVKDAVVTVKCGSGKWSLPTEDAAEFPANPVGEVKPVCRLPADQFRRAAVATSHVCPTQDGRYCLGSVLLEVEPSDEGSTQHWVATDGRRLSMMRTDTDQATDARNVLVPARVMKFMTGLAHGDGAIEVEASSKFVVFTSEHATVTGTLTDGQFPAWREIVGKTEGQPTVVEIEDLKAAVRAAAIVASERSKGVDFAWTSNTLVISARSSEYGESVVKCGLVAAGSTSPTKVDPGFVIDFLEHLPPDGEPQVYIYAADPQSRVMIRCGDITGIIAPLAADA